MKTNYLNNGFSKIIIVSLVMLIGAGAVALFYSNQKLNRGNETIRIAQENSNTSKQNLSDKPAETSQINSRTAPVETTPSVDTNKLLVENSAAKDQAATEKIEATSQHYAVKSTRNSSLAACWTYRIYKDGQLIKTIDMEKTAPETCMHSGLWKFVFSPNENYLAFVNSYGGGSCVWGDGLEVLNLSTLVISNFNADENQRALKELGLSKDEVIKFNVSNNKISNISWANESTINFTDTLGDAASGCYISYYDAKLNKSVDLKKEIELQLEYKVN